MEHYEDWELVNELQDREYDFMEDVETYELVEELQERGYYVNDSHEYISIIDSIQREELLSGFMELDFQKRQKVLNLINTLK